MTAIFSVLALSLAAFSDAKAAREPPTKAELAAIVKRGRDLAGYDAAGWYGSDAVMAKNPKPGTISGYVARYTNKGWVAAFGRFDDKKSAYLIVYEACEGKKPGMYEVETFDPPKRDTGFFLMAARAVETTLKDFIAHFQGEQRRYNVAVLPAQKDELWVYFVPAPTEPNVWPLGGDVRYLVADGGTRIKATRTLHKSIIEKPPPANKDNVQLAGFHTHVLDETVEDTDVFHVLARKPSVPEMIRTEHFVFMIEANGEAKYLGKAEDILEPKE